MALDTNYDVLVIGAGLSGLSAAKHLVEYGLRVGVLEARDRVGGRTYTKKSSKFGGYVDVGGAYVGPTQNRILQLAEELEVETYKVYEDGITLYQFHGKKEKIVGENFGSLWSPIEFLDINNFYRTVDQMGEDIPAEAPWKAKNAKVWDKMTYEEFINQTCYTKKCKDVAKLAINIGVTCEPHEASLLWFLWYNKQCGGIKRVNDTENGAQERKFVGGSQQISQKMADKFKDSIFLNEAVYGVRFQDNLVQVKTTSGKTWQSKFLILAIPPVLQMKIHFEPSLPCDRQQMCQRMPMGSIMKAFLYYETPFWRNEGFSGQLFIMEEKNHPAIWVFDDTKPDGSAPCLVLFISASKCCGIMRKSTENRKQILTDSIYEVLGLNEIYECKHYEEFNWCSEQYSGGGYTATCSPGFLTSYGKYIREPFGLAHFAGTETATRWSGYMDGAVEAGVRAAREILHRVKMIKEEDIMQEEPQPMTVVGKPIVWTYWERNLPSVRGLRNALVLLALSILALTIIEKYAELIFLRS